MFATLDDVEGQVEMLVFKAEEAESAGAIENDAVVLVRGRIDHKERGETKLVVQQAERFEPDGEEIAAATAAAAKPAEPLRLTVDVGEFSDPDSLVEELRSLFEHHRGDAAVSVVLNGSGPPRELRLGGEIRVRASSLLAELGHVPGVEALGADALAA